MIGRIAVGASIAADAIAFYTLGEWLAAAPEGHEAGAVGAWVFLLVALAAFGLPRLFGWYGIDQRFAYVMTIGIALLLMYALIRWETAGELRLWDLGWLTGFLQEGQRDAGTSGRVLIAALLLGGTWLRVSYRASDDIEMEMIPRSVGWGFIAVTGLVVLGAATGRAGEVARAGALFYALAIVALACSQLSLSGTTIGERRAGSIVSVLFGGTLVATVLGLVIFGVVFGILGPVLGPIIGSVVEGVLTVLLTPFAWVLTRVFEALLGGSNPFPNLSESALNQSRQAADQSNGHDGMWQQWLTYLLRGLALLVIFGIAAGALALLTRFRKRTASTASDDARQSIIGTAGDDLREFFRSFMPRRRTRQESYASTETTRLYLEVLEQADRDGASRLAGETATEFQPTLASRYRADVTEDITRAFEQARYAGREPDARTLEELRRRWRTVR